MRLKRWRRALTLASVGLLGLSATSAQADSIFLQYTGSTSIGATQSVYNYAAAVTGQGQVQAGDFFTLFDFGGVTSISAPGWTVLSNYQGTGIAGTAEGSSNSTTTYDLVTLDKANAYNYTFVWNGPTVPIDNSGPAVAYPLGNIVITTVPTATVVLDDYTGRDHSRAIPGNFNNFFGETTYVALSDAPGLNTMPLPPSALAGFGLISLLAGKKFRQRHAS